MDVAEMTMESRVPVAADKMRKTLTLPKTLVARVRAFRFAKEYDQESDAYTALLEKALEGIDREKRDRKRKP